MPSYTVRESRRAKHVRLTLSSTDGLVVVVPSGFDRSQLPDLVAGKAAWIERATRRLSAQVGPQALATETTLPRHITLQAIAEDWQIDYRRQAMPGVTLTELPGRRLLIQGATGNQRVCRRALQLWLHRKAHERLVPELLRLAGERGFRVARVFVRSQRTRWASCSQLGNISLNLKLLFLPPGLVRYVMLHELCHTAELNHSAAFWALVQRQEPACTIHRRQLRTARRFVPAWLG